MAREISSFRFDMSSPTSRPSTESSPDADDLKLLVALLRNIHSSLEAAESEQDAIGEVVGNLKTELQEKIYDAEDLLDEREFEQLQAMVEAPRSPTASRRYARDPVTDLLMDTSFGRRADELKRRWEKTWEFSFKTMLGPGKGQGPSRHVSTVEEPPPPPPSSSLLCRREIYGREDGVEMLVEFLLNGAVGNILTVVPIVGAAGVGKTTLVQHIYDDPDVSKHFRLRGWVSASRGEGLMELMNAIGRSPAGKDEGPMMELMKAIEQCHGPDEGLMELMKETGLQSPTGGACNYNHWGGLRDFLEQKANGHRFLLVLDDVRYETIDGDNWEKLCATFSNCAHGSVIMLTTQDERVASRAGTVPHYFLESLSGDEFPSGDPCWSVFQKHAFGSVPTDARLVEIGKKIAKECQGSTLVAKALGVRLRHERDADKWEEFLQRGMWDEVVPELKSSYQRLPAHLKRCFMYCSLFPKGYLFNTDELVPLWMAQGFIEEERGRLLEDVGLEYSDDLSSRSFFQKSPPDVGAFVIPNLLHALAQSISDGECLRIEDSNLLRLRRKERQRARHLSLTPRSSELSLTTQSLSFATQLRSLLVIPAWPLKKIAHLSSLDEALHSLNRLRVLDVRHTDIVDLPNAIGNLKHLRYLNLSGTKIRDVHASVFELYNLQTLDLSHTGIRELPDLVNNLQLLSFLYLSHTRIEQPPVSVWKLPNLRLLIWDRLK